VPPRADRFAVRLGERLTVLQADEVREAGRVTEFRVAVEGQVGRVQRALAVDEWLDALVLAPRDGVQPAPDDAVVGDQQVRVPLDGSLDSLDDAVHGERHALHLALPRPDLQAVRRGVGVGVDAQPVVELGDDLGEVHVRRGERRQLQASAFRPSATHPALPTNRRGGNPEGAWAARSAAELADGFAVRAAREPNRRKHRRNERSE